MDKEVLFEIKDNVAIVTLNRSHKRNAISKRMIEQLNDIISELNGMPLKYLLLTGAGNEAFCAGGDLNDFHGQMNEKEAYALLSPMKDVLFQIATLPYPTVAWMNGTARGGGMEIASACDFRVANESGTYGFVQGNLGISTGWGGGTLLYKRIQPTDAYFWLVHADVRTAFQLKDIQFVQDIVDSNDFEKSLLLKSFSNRSVDQMQLWKNQFLKTISIEQLKIDMENEVKACSKLWESDAHKEAVNQFFQKNN